MLLAVHILLWLIGQETVTSRSVAVPQPTLSSTDSKVKIPFYKLSAHCENFITKANLNRDTSITPESFQPNIDLLDGMLLFIGVFVGSLLSAQVFRMTRRLAYHEKNTMETNNLDAGGTISGGLIATTIVAQWTWAATLLQSSNKAGDTGISGALWYAAGASIQISLFSIVAVQLRIRAPGAKTFLRVIFSRFGARTHKVYVCFAIATNVIVTAMLMTGGSSVAHALIKECPVTLVSFLVATIVACYTVRGGMGAMFYVSYFCSAIILIIITYLVIQVFYIPSGTIGSTNSVYNLINCLTGPEGNKHRSYNTLRSRAGLIFGVINIVGNFGTVFVDQSYWQVAVAAKPKQVVYGYLVAGVVWFAIPFGMANAMGLGYLAFSSSEGQHLLREEDTDTGLVPAVVAQKLLGASGALLVLLAVVLAVLSTAAAEVSAVSSILVHDVIQIYFKCLCHSKTSCKDCANDDKLREACKLAIKPNYECPTHGEYRRYMDYLNQLKNWCLVICSFALIPLNVLTDLAGIRLGWLYSFMGVIVGSAVIPICLSMFWTRLTSEGMIAGAIGGCVAALMTWFGLISRLENGLHWSTFYRNSGEELAMLGGNLASIVAGGLFCIIVSLFTKPVIDAREVWDYTYDIDNPLYPWAETYQNELGLTDGNQLDNRPTFQSVYSKFRSLAWVANGIAVVITLIMVLILPGSLLAVGVFSPAAFRGWVGLCLTWVTLSMLYVIIAPLVEETEAALKALRLRIMPTKHCAVKEAVDGDATKRKQ